MRTHTPRPRAQRGMSLVELMIALVVLAVGLLAVGRIFPTGARSQQQDQLQISANYYAQEQLETLTGRDWSDPLLTDGRHPAGTAMDTLGSGRWTRFYEVATLAGKLDNLKKVDVTVNYVGAGRSSRSVTATTYVRR